MIYGYYSTLGTKQINGFVLHINGFHEISMSLHFLDFNFKTSHASTTSTKTALNSWQLFPIFVCTFFVLHSHCIHSSCAVCALFVCRFAFAKINKKNTVKWTTCARGIAHLNIDNFFFG